MLTSRRLNDLSKDPSLCEILAIIVHFFKFVIMCVYMNDMHVHHMSEAQLNLDFYFFPNFNLMTYT